MTPSDASSAPGPDLVAVDEALNRLAESQPLAAQVLELGIFGGLAPEEIAGALALSAAEARRHWWWGRLCLGRALLGGRLSSSRPSDGVLDLAVEAEGLPAARRSAFLDQACGDDPRRRSQVEGLVAEGSRAGAMLRGASWSPGQRRTAEVRAGDRLGAYRLLSELGSGGMSRVFLAQRVDGEYEQEVALKLLRPGAVDRGLSARLCSERQILAALSHPHIARLLDGGTTAAGEPYLVMERVEGKPIDRYCDDHFLSVPERLRLFLDVCAAVSATHRRLVVHRDLKPSNVLVTAGGVVKLLDFGIAKWVDPAADRHRITATSARPMTLAYASPEQVMAQPISTASDVYSLGVLLFELLTGTLPYRLRGESWRELEQAICEEAPSSLVQALDSYSDQPLSRRGGARRREVPALTEVCRQRSVAPRPLRRLLSGDLATILQQALRKEPERRYPSVDALVEDLRRWLERRPVLARRPTLPYRMRKWAVRNRGVAALAASLALVVGLALATLTLQVSRTARERDRAASERDRAEDVSAFLVEIFEDADPERGGTASAREILDRGAERIEERLGDRPALKIRLWTAIAQAQSGLGHYAEAGALLRRALQGHSATPGADRAGRADLLDRLSAVRGHQGDYLEAESLAREALELRQGSVGGPAGVATTLERLGTALLHQGRYAEAQEASTRALRIRRAASSVSDGTLAASLNLHALVQRKRGRHEEAAARLQEAVEILRRVQGPRHPDVLTGLHNLAAIEADAGRLESAGALLREVLAARREALGEAHPKTSKTAASLAAVLVRAGQFEEAEALSRDGLAARRRVLGETHPAVGNSLHTLASLLQQQGRSAEAEAHYREAIEILGAAGEGRLLQRGYPLASLGEMLCLAGRQAEGRGYLFEAIRLRRERLPADHPLLVAALEAHDACS